MTKAIGIDLGTTFTCVAFMKTDEIVDVATNRHSNKITPSVVHYGTEMAKVGEDAVAMRGIDPTNTIFQVKRFMGRDANDNEIKKRTYPFEIVAGSKGGVNIRVTPVQDGKKGDAVVYLPERISSDIIRYAKVLAEESTGEKVTQAVITVPANFTNAQRQATKDAGEIAGFEVLRIVNEPTAAALAYGFDKTILVYDLGGGTFDVSIVEMKGTEADVKSTRGLTFLGGEDFDYRIYEEAVAEFKEIVHNHSFEELCQDLFQKTIDCVKDAIKESGCEMNAIDDVVLVGGSSRIPRVQKLLQHLFANKKLKFDIPPDHAVAHGAAILAATLSKEEEGGTPLKIAGGGAVKLVDVTPFSLGIAVPYDNMQVIISRNSRYPTRKTELFSNAEENQTSLRFKIYEGEFAIASQNNLLGKLDIICPPRPIGENEMATTFSIDVNGILQLHVKDIDTGKEAQTTIETSKLSTEERNKMVAEAENRAAQKAIQWAKKEARTVFADALMRVKTSIRRATDEEKRKQMLAIVTKKEQIPQTKNLEVTRHPSETNSPN
ncbi:hypothetical protein PRIPAC_87924 [Pristionchus pacificus]|nr:hypothetical protein PRIPAC_87924 [Pristionchus pacificus]